MAAPPSDSIGARCSALAVLGSRELFVSATAFLPGLPRLVLAFACAHRAQWGEQSTVGMLPRLAVRHKDRRVLKMLRQLVAFPHYAAQPELSFARAPHEAAACGDLDALRWLLPPGDRGIVPPDLVDAAISCGRLDVVQWVDEAYPGARDCVRTQTLDRTATVAQLPLLRWIQHQRLGHFSADALAVAAHDGDVDVVRFVHEKCRVSACAPWGLAIAAANANLRVVQYLIAHRLVADTSEAVTSAAAHGNVDVLDVLIDATGLSTATMARALDVATQSGYGATVEWLMLRGRLLNVDLRSVLGVAAKAGDLAVVRLLHATDPSSITEDAVNAAICAGHGEVVRFCLDMQPRACSNVALNLAAVSGHVGIAMHLVRQSTTGCLFHARKIALRSGQCAVAAELAKRIDPSIRHCEIKLHRRSNRRRRCERL